MTDIVDILTDGWDAGIVAKPAIIRDDRDNRRLYQRVVSTRLSTKIDAIEGVTGRQFFTPDSHDAFICWAIDTTEAAVELMIKAIKKICATYTPVVGAETQLEWQGGAWEPFNGVRYEFNFVLIKRKSGVAGY